MFDAKFLKELTDKWRVCENDSRLVGINLHTQGVFQFSQIFHGENRDFMNRSKSRKTNCVHPVTTMSET